MKASSPPADAPTPTTGNEGAEPGPVLVDFSVRFIRVTRIVGKYGLVYFQTFLAPYYSLLLLIASILISRHLPLGSICGNLAMV